MKTLKYLFAFLLLTLPVSCFGQTTKMLTEECTQFVRLMTTENNPPLTLVDATKATRCQGFLSGFKHGTAHMWVWEDSAHKVKEGLLAAYVGEWIPATSAVPLAADFVAWSHAHPDKQDQPAGDSLLSCAQENHLYEFQPVFESAGAK